MLKLVRRKSPPEAGLVVSSRPTTSAFIGVSRSGDKWKVVVCSHGRQFFIGRFDDEIEAAMAYDTAVKNIRNRKHLKLNFEG